MARRRLGVGLGATLVAASSLAACGSSAADADAPADRSTTTSTSSTTSTTAAPTTTSTTSTTVVTTTTTAPRPVTTTTRPAAPPVTVPPAPFTASIHTVTATDLYASWHPGCPVPVSQLRAVDVTHFGNDGAVHTGRLIVAADRADAIVAIFHDLYDLRFPIQRMQPIDVYGGSDDKSIAANNTSAFNCRAVTGGTGWSEHAYGRAIDVNPFVNPYVKGATVLPPAAAAYTDRSRHDPGMIHAGDAVVAAFAARGWSWGGYWSSLKDYQHFSTTGR